MDNPFRQLKKHPIEWLSEWAIRLVASFSILLIFLIFLFVFRESLSLFTTRDSAQSSTTTSTSDSASQPETYQSESYESEAYQPDLAAEEAAVSAIPTSGIYTPKNPRYPEIYNVETGMLPPDIDDEKTPELENSRTRERSLWSNLISDVWQPVGEEPKFGIVPLVIGTTKTTFIAILFGAPLGILAALYTAFFAPRRLRNIIKPVIELLAGFPSVVIGFFCLVTAATFVNELFGTDYRLNAIVGGIGLSLAVIPIVFSIAEESLSSVPKSLREASLALGSSEWQTAYRVMLPAAAPGVFAAVLLGIGRAFGETMIAIMATGNAPLAEWSPIVPARTFAATIGSEMGEVVWGSEHYGVLFLLGSLLFVVSFSLNAVTELYIKKRLIRRFQGK